MSGPKNMTAKERAIYNKKQRDQRARRARYAAEGVEQERVALARLGLGLDGKPIPPEAPPMPDRRSQSDRRPSDSTEHLSEYDDCAQCYYCNAYLSSDHQHDHFPIGFADGGDDQVPTCRNCHSLKDQVNIENWPATMAFVGWFDLSPSGRLLIAKVVAKMSQSSALVKTLQVALTEERAKNAEHPHKAA